MLAEGDVVGVPDASGSRVACDPGTRNLFVMNVPNVRLRVRLADPGGAPRALIACALSFFDESIELVTHAELLTVVVGWRLEPQAFGFDHRFIEPWVRDRLRELAAMLRGHVGFPVTLFGHADPTGDDLHNQRLAYAGALAVFGVLTFATRIWIDLFHPHVEDRKCLPRRLSEEGWAASDLRSCRRSHPA